MTAGPVTNNNFWGLLTTRNVNTTLNRSKEIPLVKKSSLDCDGVEKFSKSNSATGYIGRRMECGFHQHLKRLRVVDPTIEITNDS